MGLLKWALILLVIAAVLGLLGFSGLAQGFANASMVLFFIFVGLVVLVVVLGAMLFRAIL